MENAVNHRAVKIRRAMVLTVVANHVFHLYVSQDRYVTKVTAVHATSVTVITVDRAQSVERLGVNAIHLLSAMKQLTHAAPLNRVQTTTVATMIIAVNPASVVVSATVLKTQIRVALTINAIMQIYVKQQVQITTIW
jgi:hypothetical protein